MIENKATKFNNSKELKEGEYIYAVGRRKTAHATVRLYKGKGDIKVNDLSISEYFPTLGSEKNALRPLEITNTINRFDISVKVYGSGKIAQADAMKLGVARALVSYDENYRKVLKSDDCLKRDPRMRERKKPGLKRARRAPQWAKR